MGRLATAVKKTFLLCSVSAAGTPQYVSIEWTGIV
jgi:tRNA splicing endonuclease